MEFLCRYEVTSAMQDTSVRQYFFTIMLGRRWLGLMAGLALALIAWQLGAPPWAAAALCAAVLVLVILWIKTYHHVIQQARSGLRLMEHPLVEVSLTDEALEYRSSTGTRRHGWDKIERMRETKDFLIFQHGKIPLLSLPKSALPAEALEWLRQRFPAA